MSDQLRAKLPDGSVKELPAGSSAGDVAAAIGPGLAKAAVAAVVDGETVDLMRPLHGEVDQDHLPSLRGGEAVERVEYAENDPRHFIVVGDTGLLGEPTAAAGDGIDETYEPQLPQGGLVTRDMSPEEVGGGDGKTPLLS